MRLNDDIVLDLTQVDDLRADGWSDTNMAEVTFSARAVIEVAVQYSVLVILLAIAICLLAAAFRPRRCVTTP